MSTKNLFRKGHSLVPNKKLKESSFTKIVDEFIKDHKDVLKELARR